MSYLMGSVRAYHTHIGLSKSQRRLLATQRTVSEDASESTQPPPTFWRYGGRGEELRGGGELGFFYIVDIKINKIMAERNAAASGQGSTRKCGAGFT